jgi:HEAT repeat protein
MPEQTGAYPTGGDDQAARQRREQVAEEAPPRPQGVVDLEDFDSTLYFLDESEIHQVAREVEHEYRRDIRSSALNVLFDLFELEGEAAIRSEILDIVELLFPNLLNARDFRTAAAVLRESKLLAGRAKGLGRADVVRLDAFVAKLSEPAIVEQLLQSLDEAPAMAGEAEVAEVLRELRGSALEPVLAAIPAIATPGLRTLLEGVADRLASSQTEEVLRILRSPDSPALASVVTLCGRLGLHQVVPGLAATASHPDPAVRLASVHALAQLGTPGALALVDKAIEDDDRIVRLAAVRVAGGRGYKGALKRVEAVVLGKGVKGMDLTEKMAFFEAYGAIAGAGAVKALAGMLLPRGLLKLKESSETRACAAIALGRIRTPEARDILTRVAEDKDLVVRNAVSRALREGGA